MAIVEYRTVFWLAVIVTELGDNLYKRQYGARFTVKPLPPPKHFVANLSHSVAMSVPARTNAAGTLGDGNCACALLSMGTRAPAYSAEKQSDAESCAEML